MRSTKITQSQQENARRQWTGVAVTAAAVALALVPAVGQAAPETYSASGANAAAITAAVTDFRADLGTLNPNQAGSFGSGRREVNWDGVPVQFASPNFMPANFFNVNSPRGNVYATPGSGFLVSQNAANGPVRFADINPTYETTFQTFSAQKLFVAAGSTITDVLFFVPGSTTPAFTTAFGAVFADVDLADTTSLSFYDLTNSLIGTYYVPTADNGLSFLGVRFQDGERIGRVRINSGNAALAVGVNDGPGTDLVAMDDFIYAEPLAATAAVPEAGTLPLTVAGLLPLAGFVVARRRKGIVRAAA